MRLVLYGYEGSGLGHLTRLSRLGEYLAVHGADEVVLTTGHPAAALVAGQGIKIHQLPSRRTDGVADRTHDVGRARTWYGEAGRKRLRQSLEAVICNQSPNVFVTDHRPRGLFGELDGILERGKIKSHLLLRGVLDDVEPATRELSDDFSHRLTRRYKKIWVCCDRRLIDVVAMYPFLKTHAPKIEYAGFLGPHFTSAEVNTARRAAMGRHGDRWLVISAGAGTYHGQAVPSALESVLPCLDDRWVVDVVYGPYSDLRPEHADRKTDRRTKVRLHRQVSKLPLWHYSSDVLITSGGSNTILEGVLGGAWVIPALRSDAGEIHILTRALAALGVCDHPVSPPMVGRQFQRCRQVRNESRASGLDASGLEVLSAFLGGDCAATPPCDNQRSATAGGIGPCDT